MYPFIRSRDVDIHLLSRFLDDLNLSHKWHLDMFCLIQRYCFIAQRCFVKSLLTLTSDSGHLCFLNFNKQPSKQVAIPLAYSELLSLGFQCAASCLTFEIFFLPRLGRINSCVLVSNIETEKFWRLPTVNSIHSHGDIVLLNEMSDVKTLMVVGSLDTPHTKTTQEFHFEHNKWTCLADMNNGRGDFATVVVEPNSVEQNHIFVMGGCGGNTDKPQLLKSVEMYCKETNSWTKLKQMKYNKKHFLGTIHRDKVVAGPHNNNYLEEFDLHHQVWMDMPSLPRAGFFGWGYRYPIGVTDAFHSRGFRLFVVGSRSLVEQTNFGCYLFDDKTDTWQTLQLPCFPRLPTCGLLNKSI